VVELTNFKLLYINSWRLELLWK